MSPSTTIFFYQTPELSNCHLFSYEHWTWTINTEKKQKRKKTLKPWLDCNRTEFADSRSVIRRHGIKIWNGKFFCWFFFLLFVFAKNRKLNGFMRKPFSIRVSRQKFAAKFHFLFIVVLYLGFHLWNPYLFPYTSPRASCPMLFFNFACSTQSFTVNG